MVKDEYVKVLKDHLRKLLSGETQKIMINYNGSASCVIITRKMYDYFLQKCGALEQKPKLNPAHYSKSQKTLLKVAPKIAIFDRLTQEQIIQISHHVKFLRFEKDEALMHYGQVGNDVYYVLQGRFSVQVPCQESEQEVEVAQIERGAILGEIAPVVHQKRSASVVALQEESVVLSFKIDFENKEVACATYKQLYKNFNTIMAKKLMESNRAHAG